MFGADLQRSMIEVSFVDSLFDEEKARSFLFLVKETTHSLSLIFGLAFVALVLTRQGMDKGRVNARDSAVG